MTLTIFVALQIESRLKINSLLRIYFLAYLSYLVAKDGELRRKSREIMSNVLKIVVKIMKAIFIAKIKLYGINKEL